MNCRGRARLILTIWVLLIAGTPALAYRGPEITACQIDGEALPLPRHGNPDPDKPDDVPPVSAEKTAAYLSTFHLDRFRMQGSDVSNAVYSAAGVEARLFRSFGFRKWVEGTPGFEDTVDRMRDYDYCRLAYLEKQLGGVDRKTVLQYLWQQLTAGLSTDKQKHIALQRFINQAILYNPYMTPAYPMDPLAGDTIWGVWDPLLILELGEGKGSHMAKLACDIAYANGWDCRVAGLSGRYAAEVSYTFPGKDWHFLDPYLFGGDLSQLSSYFFTASIPSIDELSHNPHLLDALPVLWKPAVGNRLPAPGEYPYPSFSYFSKGAYFGADGKPLHYPGDGRPISFRKERPETWQKKKAYGWDLARVVTHPNRRLWDLADLPAYFAPSPPKLSSLSVVNNRGIREVTLAWHPSVIQRLPNDHQDNEVMGYVVLISTTSRGWNYDGDSVEPGLMPFKSGGSRYVWKPEHYDSRFQPHYDAALPALKEDGQTGRSYVEPPASGDVTKVLRFYGGGGMVYYMSVMAYDKRGQIAGRMHFPISEEIKLRLP